MRSSSASSFPSQTLRHLHHFLPSPSLASRPILLLLSSTSLSVSFRLLAFSTPSSSHKPFLTLLATATSNSPSMDRWKVRCGTILSVLIRPLRVSFTSSTTSVRPPLFSRFPDAAWRGTDPALDVRFPFRQSTSPAPRRDRISSSPTLSTSPRPSTTPFWLTGTKLITGESPSIWLNLPLVLLPSSSATVVRFVKS